MSVCLTRSSHVTLDPCVDSKRLGRDAPAHRHSCVRARSRSGS